MTYRVLLTCEHGGHRVPAAFRHLFASCGRVLRSHRGWDCGALDLARCLAHSLQAPLVHSQITRLLVDLNRSVTSPSLLSRYMLGQTPKERDRLIAHYYRPFRDRVEEWIAQALSANAEVAHFSIHTFTPVLRGTLRTADVGLLYDPARRKERELCERWRRCLSGRQPGLRIRKNYPYTGISDGFTTYLRRRFGTDYLGIELEVNQRWPRNRPVAWKKLQGDLAESLRQALDESR
jgi:predicted N-formylglutamate amidohydrolase